MLNGMHTLDDFKLKGKTVLARFDMNSPLDPDTREPVDITRIERCLPTLRELTHKGAKTVILIHQGSDIEYHNYASVRPHAKILSRLLAQSVTYVDDVCGPTARKRITTLKKGQILMLENVRFMAEEMTLFETKLNLSPEEQAQTRLVQKLAPLADLYLCDAFAAAHRCQPTLVGMEEVLPSLMGRLFESEVISLNQLLQNPKKPCVFILGGAKIQDAFLMMEAILKNKIADTILTTGLVAQVMLLAKGISLGQPSEALIKKKNLEAYIDQSRTLLKAYGPQIKLPLDLAFIRAGLRQEVDLTDLPLDEALLDLGHATLTAYTSIIKEAQTLFFNGPAGVFEKKETEQGTKVLLTAMAQSKAFSALGGGDSITALNKYQLTPHIDYISTGGGALVRYLSGEELPVVKALRKAAKRLNVIEV